MENSKVFIRDCWRHMNRGTTHVPILHPTLDLGGIRWRSHHSPCLSTWLSISWYIVCDTITFGIRSPSEPEPIGHFRWVFFSIDLILNFLSTHFVLFISHKVRVLYRPWLQFHVLATYKRHKTYKVVSFLKVKSLFLCPQPSNSQNVLYILYLEYGIRSQTATFVIHVHKIFLISKTDRHPSLTFPFYSIPLLLILWKQYLVFPLLSPDMKSLSFVLLYTLFPPRFLQFNYSQY